jgi:hypothetical protein
MRTCDRIRDYARRQYIEPARKRGQPTVRVVAGDIYKALRLTGRVPAICSALASRQFLRDNGLRLERREGPPSGQSTTVVFTYGLATGEQAKKAKPRSPFYDLRGIGKDVFEALGGGEAFIRSERDHFYGPGQDPSKPK